MDQHGDLSEKNYRKVDCKNSRISILCRVFYTQPKGEGRLTNYNKDLNKWNFVIPDSVNEIMLNLVCKR